MKRLDERIPATLGADTAEARRFQTKYAWFWAAFVMVMVLLTQPLSRAWTSTLPFEPYESELRIAGLPFYASGQYPRAVIAVGAFPVGVIAVGGLPVGVVALGGMAAGVIALSGVSLGILAFGGLAIGWWALGGGAIGYHSFGGLAVGGYAYAGNGVARGYHFASGRQSERLWG